MVAICTFSTVATRHSGEQKNAFIYLFMEKRREKCEFLTKQICTVCTEIENDGFVCISNLGMNFQKKPSFQRLKLRCEEQN